LPINSPLTHVLASETTAEQDCELANAITAHLLPRIEAHPMRQYLAELVGELHDSAYNKGGCRADAMHVRCDVDDRVIDGEPTVMICGAKVHPECEEDHYQYCDICGEGSDGVPADVQELTRRILSLMCKEYVQSGYMMSGCMKPERIAHEVGGDDDEARGAIKVLVERGHLRRRECIEFVYELSPAMRLRLIERHNLAEAWGEGLPGCEVANTRREAAEESAQAEAA
jgi:hypothetical protein